MKPISGNPPRINEIQASPQAKTCIVPRRVLLSEVFFRKCSGKVQ